MTFDATERWRLTVATTAVVRATKIMNINDNIITCVNIYVYAQ